MSVIYFYISVVKSFVYFSVRFYLFFFPAVFPLSFLYLFQLMPPLSFLHFFVIATLSIFMFFWSSENFANGGHVSISYLIRPAFDGVKYIFSARIGSFWSIIILAMPFRRPDPPPTLTSSFFGRTVLYDSILFFPVLPTLLFCNLPSFIGRPQCLFRVHFIPRGYFFGDVWLQSSLFGHSAWPVNYFLRVWFFFISESTPGLLLSLSAAWLIASRFAMFFAPLLFLFGHFPCRLFFFYLFLV